MRRITHVDLSAIRRLLAAGVRHAEIARRLNLAVGTISRIASDRKLRRRKLDLVADADLPDDEDNAPPEYAATNLRRCPACGGMVYQWPCLACRMRGHASREGKAPAEPPTERRSERGTERAMQKMILPPSLNLSVTPSLLPSVISSNTTEPHHVPT